MLEEVATPRLEGSDVALVVTRLDPGDLRKPAHPLGPVGSRRLEVRVGPERRHDAPAKG